LDLLAFKPDAKIVGVPVLRAAASTLELALRLQPDTRNIAVVAGSSLSDLESAEQFRRETQTFEHGVGFTWLTNLSIYGSRDTYLGYGVVGGSMVTFEKIGREAARLGIRTLVGEEAQTAAQSESSKAAPRRHS
jgi:hypothetical protein